MEAGRTIDGDILYTCDCGALFELEPEDVRECPECKIAIPEDIEVEPYDPACGACGAEQGDNADCPECRRAFEMTEAFLRTARALEAGVEEGEVAFSDPATGKSLTISWGKSEDERAKELGEPGTLDSPSSDDEARDAEKVNKAVEYLINADVQSARLLLEEVVAKAPEEYVYQHDDGDTRYIRFWDKKEFDHYVTWQRDHGDTRPVTWMPSAYPPAYYYLGFISVKEQQYSEAIALLDAGLRLEPTNPKFLFEKAVAYTLLGDYQSALSLYDQVQEVGPHVSPADKAQALRSKAIILVQMGDLDAGEALLNESLAYDPDSSVAANELAVIEGLRAGAQLGSLTFRETRTKTK